MKSPILYFFLLLIWVGGSTWYYVCKIKHHCEDKTIIELIKGENEEAETNQDFTSEILNEIPSESVEKTKEEIIDDVRSKIENGYTILNFPENSVQNQNIEASFDEFVENLSIYMKENKTDKIEIIGHTDDTGSDEANITFGLKRAKFIKKKLIAAGISADRIIVKSKGKSEPVASNESEEGKQKNRRVVLKLIQN